MSQSHNELSSGRVVSGSVALNANEEERGGARWRVGVALTSLWPLYHALMLTVDLSQWLVDTQSFKLFSLTQNLIRMEKHRMKKLQLSGYSRMSPNVEDRIHHAGMDSLLRNCATGCCVDEAFTMDDLVDLISADTSGLRCGHAQLRIVFITPVWTVC
ncbi:hypothetical protein DPX16_4190 [Anabarilius grahami]|uniref:Uncharacterized protein n=1 Tax=Anabarilius grahami TaxID=495550 RepID=A0A3N0XRE4_ANAGA|nr:hypothetical protein DPX16_4190 [Anabarilius grahami]